jgi:hypothetical protein
VSRRTAAVVAWSLVGLSTALGCSGTLLKVAVEGVDGWHFVATDVVPILLFFVSAAVGALIASRLPANPVGWLFVGLAVSLGVLATDRGWTGGFTPWAAWYASVSFLALFATFLYTLLLFPDGRLASRRWRIASRAGSAGLACFVIAILFKSGKLEGYRRFTNPIGIDSPVVTWAAAPGILLFSGALIAAAVSLVVRLRRSSGAERQQLTLLVASGVLATTVFVLSWFLGAVADSEDLDVAVTLLGILAIPVAIGVAMLRYRLYEVDRVISRTLVYGALTVILGAAYAGLVLAGQALFSSFAGGSNLAIAVSTLVVAALFLPLRARVQHAVDRRFYRRRYDAQRTLEAFGARLREQVELTGLRADLERVVRDTMQPAHVSLWLREARP